MHRYLMDLEDLEGLPDLQLMNNFLEGLEDLATSGIVGGLVVPALRRLGIECDGETISRENTRAGLRSGRGAASENDADRRRKGKGGVLTGESQMRQGESMDAESLVLVRSEKDDGPAAKRGGGRRDRAEGGGKTFGSFDEADGSYGIDVRETFRFVDRQYITPMFTPVSYTHLTLPTILLV